MTPGESQSSSPWNRVRGFRSCHERDTEPDDGAPPESSQNPLVGEPTPAPEVGPLHPAEAMGSTCRGSGPPGVGGLVVEHIEASVRELQTRGLRIRTNGAGCTEAQALDPIREHERSRGFA